jgi:hypothetical protein
VYVSVVRHCQHAVLGGHADILPALAPLRDEAQGDAGAVPIGSSGVGSAAGARA